MPTKVTVLLMNSTLTQYEMICINRFGTFQEISSEWWYDVPYIPPTSKELELHQELLSRWTTFAKNGNPNNNRYSGWDPVPYTGPSDGWASEISQFMLSDDGTHGNSVSVITRCNAFPKFIAFKASTFFPTFAPTDYNPIRTRRPTRKVSKS